MSFLSWFGKNGAAPATAASQSTDLDQVDATLPTNRPPSAAVKPQRNQASSSSRSERLERRELLYSLVRESMTLVGVLSSSYKFKVLSLDSNGRQYLILMELPRAQLADPAHFTEIEGLIARSAKERHDILVTAVYWRVNHAVTAAGARSAIASRAVQHVRSPEPAHAAAPARVAPRPSPRAPLQDEEVRAFKRALAAAAGGAAPAALGQVVHSGRRNPEPIQDFSDTEPFDASSPLGTSQFGGL